MENVNGVKGGNVQPVVTKVVPNKKSSFYSDLEDRYSISVSDDKKDSFFKDKLFKVLKIIRNYTIYPVIVVLASIVGCIPGISLLFANLYHERQMEIVQGSELMKFLNDNGGSPMNYWRQYRVHKHQQKHIKYETCYKATKLSLATICPPYGGLCAMRLFIAKLYQTSPNQKIIMEHSQPLNREETTKYMQVATRFTQANRQAVASLRVENPQLRQDHSIPVPTTNYNLASGVNGSEQIRNEVEPSVSDPARQDLFTEDEGTNTSDLINVPLTDVTKQGDAKFPPVVANESGIYKFLNLLLAPLKFLRNYILYPLIMGIVLGVTSLPIISFIFAVKEHKKNIKAMNSVEMCGFLHDDVKTEMNYIRQYRVYHYGVSCNNMSKLQYLKLFLICAVFPVYGGIRAAASLARTLYGRTKTHEIIASHSNTLTENEERLFNQAIKDKKLQTDIRDVKRKLILENSYKNINVAKSL